MEQQKAKIQQHLKSLRADSVKDYLSEKLDTLASKQVINDILDQFISNHDSQFLQSIACSIASAKIKCNELKSQLKLKQQQYEDYKSNCKNQIREQYQSKCQKLLNQWTLLQLLCQQKAFQKNPIKAIQNITNHLKQVLQNNQILQKSLKQVEQKIRIAQSYHQSQMLQLKQNWQNKVKQLLSQKHQLQKQNGSYKGIIQQLKLSSALNDESIQSLKQQLKNAENSHKQSRELLDFLQNKVCQMKENNMRLKYEVQIVSNQKNSLSAQTKKLKENDNLLNTQIGKKNSELAQKSILLQKNSYNLKQLQTKIIEQKAHSQLQIKRLSQELKAVKNQNCYQKNQLQKSFKMQALLTQDQNKWQKSQKQLTEQLFALKQALNTKYSSFRSYVLKKDQQIKIVEDQLNILRNQLDESQQRQSQYQQYLLELNQLRSKLKRFSQEYDQTNIQIDDKIKGSIHILLKTKKTKTYYLHKSLKTKYQFMKNQLQQTKQKNKEDLQCFKNYMFNMIKFIIQKANEQKINCSYCDHKDVLQKNVKISSIQQQKSIKQMEKTTKFKNQFSLSNNNRQQQQNIFQPQKSISNKWSKHLRELNQKFRTIDLQNKQYKMHLDSFLNNQK